MFYIEFKRKKGKKKKSLREKKDYGDKRLFVYC